MNNLRLGLLIAFSYFSFIPIKINDYKIDDTITKYLLFFIPFVGFCLGFISFGLYYLLSYFFVPIYSALVVGIVYFLLYGFLHLEAICDVVDGYFASYSKKDVHKIMKDPTVGAMGIIAIVLFLIIKLASIVYLCVDGGALFLLLAFTMSRLSVHYVLVLFTFHDSSKMANSLKTVATKRLLFFTTLFYISLVSLISIYSIFIFVSMIYFAYMIVKKLQKQLGFVNGDVIGFCIEMCELFVMIVLIVLY